MTQKNHFQIKKEIIFLFIASFLSAATFAQTNVKETLIKSKSIGNVSLLQNINELKKNTSWTVKKTSIQIEGEEQPSYKITENGSTIFELKPEYNDNTHKFTNRIGEIKTTSVKFKTASNIGIKSTISDFIKAYPQYKLWYGYEGDVFGIETPLLPNVQFEIDGKGFKGSKQHLIDTNTGVLKLSDFAKTTKIIAVRVF